MKWFAGFAAAATVAMSACAPTQAAIVSYSFSGVQIPTGGSSSADFGSTFTGSFSYDTAGPFISGDDVYKIYDAFTSISLQSGLVSFTVDRTQGVGDVTLYNDGAYQSLEQTIGDGRSPVTGNFSNISVYLDNSSTTALFNGLSLPASLAFNPDGGSQISVFGGGLWKGKILSITPTATSPVPEPGTWALMLVGVGLAGVKMRRRKVGVVFG